MTSSKSKSEPYDEFLACIKLVSGEEILSKVVIDSSDNQKIIIYTILLFIQLNLVKYILRT